MLKLLAAGLMSLALIACSSSKPSLPPSAGAVVKVLAGDGHGSGVHLGNQIILTAAHVVDGVADVTIKADDGSVRSATVLWANKAHDVALVRLDRPPQRLASASLSCREPSPGEAITASGNPGNIEFVTTYGRVAGKARPVANLKSVSVFDGTVAPGMSGGPIMDSRGHVVGVTVALMVVPTGYSASLIPVSYFVPAPVVCMLMGR